MGSLDKLFFLLFSMLLTTVNCLQPIVVPNTISDTNGTFSVYCDATRLPGSIDNIVSLLITRMVTGTTTYTDIAQYSGVTFPTNASFTNIPPGRNWTITFNGLGTGTNNRNTMTTVLNVNDAMCSDAGTYMCSVTYQTSSNKYVTLNNTQNVTAVAEISDLTLTVNPVMSDYDDQTITFTCRFYGPESVRPTWELWIIYNKDEGYKPYDVLTDAVTNNLVSQSNNSCQRVLIVSTLQVQLTSSDIQNMYRCVAKTDSQEESSNISICINGRISAYSFTVFPETPELGYDEENITFTCQFSGPESVQPQWELWTMNNKTKEYTMNRELTDAVTNDPVPQNNSGDCREFFIKSTLKVQLTSNDNQTMYRCAAKSGNTGISSKIKILVKGETGSATTPSGTAVGIIMCILIGLSLQLQLS